VAKRLGPKVSRREAKQAFYALTFGQSQNGFVNAQTEMTIGEATWLYQRLKEVLPRAFEFLEQTRDSYDKSQGVYTRGGWRRLLDTGRNAPNTAIQGLGADVFRYVLRDLANKLPPWGAQVVHFVHDEVIVRCPDQPDPIAKVKAILKDSMLNAGLRSGLIADPQLLLDVKGPHVGRTLAEVS
jgi:DNA polymerase I-like protein with 3'-5' exonuclease and polymerase domains